MSGIPQQVQFSFIANNTSAEDESGTARWVVPVWHRGEWDTETTDIEFTTFRDAHRMNGILSEVWKAGEAEGYADCERKVLSALRT